MSPRPPSRRAHALRAAAIAGVLWFAALPGFAQRAGEAAGPFAGFAGAWTGSGTITTSSGTNERIRCRARYAVTEGGRLLQQELRCASDSYKFEVTSNVNFAGGSAIFGSWSELTRNAAGNLTGNVRGGQIQAQVEGVGFSASLALTTSGDRQSVMIRPNGTDVTAVSISLRRG